VTDHDETLEKAARALREATQAPSPNASATRARILRAHAARGRVSSQWLAAAAVLLVTLGAPTAWAFYTGRATRWIEAVLAPRTAAPASELSGRSEEPNARPIRRPRPELAPEPAPLEPLPTELVPEPQPSDPTLEAEPTPTPGPDTAELTRPLPEDTSEREERISYRRAHALQFESGDHAAAIAAYDSYLRRYPAGRFATEAEYNRATSLAHEGRSREAIRALTPFARGSHGEYRREEARELIEALQASPPL